MIIITQPAIEPVTLAEMRTQIGINLAADTVSDTTITRRIKEARMFCENYMQRPIITQTKEIRLNSFPNENYGKIKLTPNLLSIVSVKYIDTNGTEQTLGSSNYVMDNYSRIGKVTPVYGVVWPSTRNEPNAVRVQFTCGYGPAVSDVPDLIREAIMLLVGHWMNFQPSIESGTTITRVPFAATDLLDHYRIMEVV